VDKAILLYRALESRILVVEALVFLALFTASGIILGYTSTLVYTPFNIARLTGDTLLVYSPGSTLVYTGLVPVEVAGILLNESSGIRVSPEVVAPVMLGDKVFFTRGVYPGSLNETVSIEVTSGVYSVKPLNAIVGYRLSARAGIKPGDVVCPVSLFNGRVLCFNVTGVFRSSTLLDDELVVYIDDARYLRGVSSNQVSFVRVKPGSSRDVELVNSLLNASATTSAPSIPGWLLELVSRLNITSSSIRLEARYAGDVSRVARASMLMGLGASLLLSTLLVVAFSGLYTTMASQSIRVLYEEGLPPSRIASWIILFKTPLLITVSVASYMLASILLPTISSSLTLMYHSTQYYLDPSTYILYTATTILLYLASLYLSVRGVTRAE